MYVFSSYILYVISRIAEPEPVKMNRFRQDKFQVASVFSDKNVIIPSFFSFETFSSFICHNIDCFCPSFLVRN